MKTKFGRAYIGNHGYYVITSQKEGNHNKLLHRLIYEEAHGKIPNGYHVHHKDGNKLNNSIDNLELLEKREHHSLHSTGYNHTMDTRVLLSNQKKGKSMPSNKTGYYRVYKEKGDQYAQGFTYTYQVDESRLNGGKRIKKKIRRVNLSDLEKAVKEAGYEWKKINE